MAHSRPADVQRRQQLRDISSIEEPARRREALQGCGVDRAPVTKSNADGIGVRGQYLVRGLLQAQIPVEQQRIIAW